MFRQEAMWSNLPIPPAGKSRILFTIRRASLADIPVAMAFVEQVFNLTIAEEYSSEGVETFLSYVIDIEAAKKRLQDHFILLAYDRERLAGMIEIRNYDHISLLFVAPEFQKMGCAGQLFDSAMRVCKDNKLDFSSISVNSSPYAVPIYRRMGFKEISAEMVVNGIRFTKMIWDKE